MNITLNFSGLLKELIGSDSVTITFEKDANFGDLLKRIHHRYGERLPTSVWDGQKMEFRPGILCVGEGRDLEAKDTRLKEGEIISIAVHMAGG